MQRYRVTRIIRSKNSLFLAGLIAGCFFLGCVTPRPVVQKSVKPESGGSINVMISGVEPQELKFCEVKAIASGREYAASKFEMLRELKTDASTGRVVEEGPILGLFRIEGVPIGTAEVGVRFKHETVPAQAVEVKRGSSVTAYFSFTSKKVTLSGKVTQLGKPASEWLMMFRSTDGKAEPATAGIQTAHDGSYNYKLNPGTYEIQLSEPAVVEINKTKVAGWSPAFTTTYTVTKSETLNLETSILKKIDTKNLAETEKAPQAQEPYVINDKRVLQLSGPGEFVSSQADNQSIEDNARLNQQVVQLYQQGRYKEAIALAEKALAIWEEALDPDHLDIATGLNNLAMLYKTMGDYRRAEPLYTRSLTIREKILGPDHPGVAEILNNLAMLCFSLGDYQKAEFFNNRSLATREKALGPNHPDVGNSLNNLAALYGALGDYQRAELFNNRSLAIREKALGHNHPDVARSLNNLATIYQTFGDYQKAEALYMRSLSIREKVLGPDHPDVAQSFNNLAMLYLERGDYQKAEPLLKRSIAIYEKSLGPSHLSVAQGKANLALLYLNTEKLEEAYSIFKKGNSPGGIAKYYLIKKNYTQAEIELSRGLNMEKTTSRANVLIGYHIGLGFVYEGKGDYASAKTSFKEAINIIEKQWHNLSFQAKKNFMNGQVEGGFSRIEAYEGMVRVIVKEWGKKAGEDALTIAERVKGRLLLEMLATRQLKGKTKEDETVLKKDREFQEVLISLRKRIEVIAGSRAETPQKEINALINELVKKEKEYTTFIEEVKLTGSEFSSLLTVDPLPPAKIQSLLDPETSLLEYLTTKDATYAWLVTRDAIKVYEIPITERELLNKVDAFLSLNITNKARKTVPVVIYVPVSGEKDATLQEREMNRRHFTQASQGFYKDIVAPVEKDIKTKKLMIVPHGVLHKIPFATLSDGKGYLMERYSLSILPSASVLEYVVKKRKPNKDKILTLANPATDYVSLEFAEAEGNTISRLFPKSELCIKEKATETLSKNRSGDFNVIHFASHGQFNERQPLQSGLILAKDSENDGFLQVHEVFGLDLRNANLVTLSACETALAKIQGGDDLVGLSRGFIYAGTPSLLATLWAVDDQSTSILMEHFYKNWLKGMTKPEALRQAQITLKQIPQYAHPFYWAPFVMIGDWQ